MFPLIFFFFTYWAGFELCVILINFNSHLAFKIFIVDLGGFCVFFFNFFISLEVFWGYKYFMAMRDFFLVAYTHLPATSPTRLQCQVVGQKSRQAGRTRSIFRELPDSSHHAWPLQLWSFLLTPPMSWETWPIIIVL